MTERSRKRRIYDNRLYAHFITTSCYNRRKIFLRKEAVEIFEWALSTQLQKQDAKLPGYVIMPEHVHFIVSFSEPNQLSRFIKQIKQRSSKWIRKKLNQEMIEEWGPSSSDDPVWQTKYYSFEIESQEKLIEKLHYIHENPVRKSLCQRASDWEWSSARYYETGNQGTVFVSQP